VPAGDPLVPGSDRTFGLVLAAAAGLVALRLWWSSNVAWPVPLVLAAVLVVLAVFRAGSLRPANLLWMKLGRLMGRIVSPLVLGIMFFGIVTPIGFLMRVAGKSPLKLNYDPSADSYWIPRNPPGPAPESMGDPF